MRKQNFIQANITTIIIVVVFAFLFVINLLRVFNVAVTHDEGLMYQQYITKPWGDLFNFYKAVPDNQMLNTVLTKFFIGLFGDKIFSLRLTSVLALAVFIIYSIIGTRLLFKKDSWVVAASVLLMLNPYLFEFWGLSRGYSLAIAFMLASLYHLVRYKEGKWYQLLLAMSFAVLAVISHLVMLHYFIAFTFITLLMLLRKNRREKILNAVLIVAAGIVALYNFVAIPLATLYKKKQLYYGASESMFKNTFSDLIQRTFHVENEQLLTIYSEIILLTIIVSGIFWTIKIIKNNKRSFTGVYIWLLIVLPLLSIYVFHIVGGINFPSGRAALFISPLFIIHLIYWLHYINDRFVPLSSLVITLLCIISFGNFLRDMNIKETTDWKIDKRSLAVMDQVTRHSSAGEKISLKISETIKPPIEYYANTDYKNVKVEGFADNLENYTPYDYVYLDNSSGDNIRRVYGYYEVDTVYHDVETTLYKRKEVK